MEVEKFCHESGLRNACRLSVGVMLLYQKRRERSLSPADLIKCGDAMNSARSSCSQRQSLIDSGMIQHLVKRRMDERGDVVR